MHSSVQNPWWRDAISYLEEGVKFIFSWFGLLPTAIILGGKFLSQVFPNFSCSKQLLRIPLKNIYEITATDIEVIYGLLGFILTFFSLALYAGKDIYLMVKDKFGIDPGQFYALQLFCSFATVLWSFLLFTIYTLCSRIYRYFNRDISLERDRLIEMLAKKDKRG